MFYEVEKNHFVVDLTKGAKAMSALRKTALILFCFFISLSAHASPAEDADAALSRWSSAYTSNDLDAVVSNYWPEAILLGTVSPVMSEGLAAIRTYFTPLQKSGNRNALGERRTIVLNDSAVIVTGFYEFTRIKDGVAVPGPSRFTMLMVKRGSEWKIQHHHSSPHVQPAKPT